MDLTNKIALLTHEISYVFQPAPVEDGDEAVNAILATSSKARFLNGYFYQQGWQKNWNIRLKRELVLSAEGSLEFYYNYLYHAMSANEGNRTRVVKMSIEGGWAMADGNSGLQPTFSLAVVNGGNFGGHYGLLRRNSPPQAIFNLCEKALHDRSGSFSETMYTGAEANYEEMKPVMGRIVLSSAINAISILSLTGEVDQCAHELAQAQKTWLK